MADLRTYMSTEFFEDSLIIADLEEHMSKASHSFEKSFDSTAKSWPYELTTNTSSIQGVDSQSTTAMILSSILAMQDEWGKVTWRRAASGMLYASDFRLPSNINKAIHKSFAKEQIVETVSVLISKWTGESHITQSGTFGLDDPMSIGWALDLLRWMRDRAGQDTKALLGKLVVRSVQRAQALVGMIGAGSDTSLCTCLMSPSEGRRVGDSSYILTRFAAVLRAILSDDSLTEFLNSEGQRVLHRAEKVLAERFEARLHDHLSFAEIEDSRFDPTELAFCLEGILLVRDVDAVATTLFARVMEVLRVAQRKGAYWRAETPILYKDNGDVLFTVSVEAANAVLASFRLYDGRWRVYNSSASEYVDLLKRYWRWLKARKTSVRIGDDLLDGWHSEHVNDPNLVHLWETSQVTEFLVNFRDQLSRHVARTSLRLAACSYKGPSKPSMIEVDSQKPSTPFDRWQIASALLEPTSCLGDRYKVFDLIGTRFVLPRAQQSDKKLPYSMLLYGPPGTGKTTVASCLSWALDFPLITITVSDFLADGHAAIEARAKDLFDMLRAQPRSVVLFDEIDQFMLDRDSEFFREQQTVFQFLTPGMLTKLAELHDSEAVIFIMATNYAERIDAAIKRQGRIDHHFLLLPPDLARRRRFITDLWRNAIELKAAGEKSVFLGYNDLKSISLDLSGNAAVAAIVDAVPPIRPEGYVPRFQRKDGTPINDVRGTPSLEFIAMVALEADAKGMVRGTPKWKSEIESKCHSYLKDLRPEFIKELNSFFGATN
jgi:hypothetical protein